VARWKGTTTQRGMGSHHQRLREQRLALYRPGDICVHGGEAMWWWPLAVARQYLDLPHTADRSGYLPGLSCRYHNRAEGATRGNHMRSVASVWRTARRW
jgi:hypothetical protein